MDSPLHRQVADSAEQNFNQEVCCSSSQHLEKERGIIQCPSFTIDQLKSAKLNRHPSIDANPNLGVIVQARIGSSRLPGKIAKVVAGKEYLVHQIERILQKCPKQRCVIATTTERQDDVVCDIASNMGVGVYRGDSNDVLKRYILSAKEYGFTDVVRLTGDCPLIDPYIMDLIIRIYNSAKAERKYVSNTIFRTFPRGFDVEIISLTDLNAAWQSSKNQFDQEHVTPFIKSGAIPQNQRISCSYHKDLSRWRFTLDTIEDHLQLSEILKGINGYEMGQVIEFAAANNLLQLDYT